ncbi:hypothetical protein GN496_24915 [Salmonella enterica]|nr:hypothetical protein [Salmonella enterica]
MPGFNIKYHREDPETNLGVTGSFACTRKSESSDGISGKLTYSSYTVGPSYRFNDYLNGYLLVGQGYGKIEASDEDTSVSASKTSFAYGTGGGKSIQWKMLPLMPPVYTQSFLMGMAVILMPGPGCLVWITDSEFCN